MGYPWRTGQRLTATDLDAAIASALGGAPGSWVPISGGVMTGTLILPSLSATGAGQNTISQGSLYVGADGTYFTQINARAAAQANLIRISRVGSTNGATVAGYGDGLYFDTSYNHDGGTARQIRNLSTLAIVNSSPAEAIWGGLLSCTSQAGALTGGGPTGHGSVYVQTTRTSIPRGNTTVLTTLGSPGTALRIADVTNFLKGWSGDVAYPISGTYPLPVKINGTSCSATNCVADAGTSGPGTLTLSASVSVSDGTAGNLVIGQVVGANLWGGVIEFRDTVDQPSSIGGFGQTLELDWVGNNVDDAGKRAIISLVLSKNNLGGVTPTGGGITFNNFGNGETYTSALLMRSPFNGAVLDTRSATQQSGANAIWLATNQTIALSTDGKWAIKSDNTGIQFLYNGSALGYWDMFSNLHAPGGVTSSGTVLSVGFSNPGNTYTLSGATVPTPPAAFAGNFNGTSTIAGNTSLSLTRVSCASDTAALTNAGTLNYSMVVANLGTGWQGGRAGFMAQINQTAATTLANSQDGMVGLQAQVVAAFNAGGSATGFGVSSFGMGSLFGANPWAQAKTGATYWQGIVGEEVNASIQTGASASYFALQQLIITSDHATHGTNRDDGVVIASQVGASAGIKGAIISVGSYDAQWPVNANGYILQTKTGNNNSTNATTAAGGIDLSQVNFSGAGPVGGGFAVRTPGFQVLNSGALQAGFGAIDGSSGGLQINPSYQQLSGTPAVSAGGTGWTVGDLAADTNGNIVKVATVSAGAIATVTVVQRGWLVTPPSNPVTFTALTRSGTSYGASATLALAWAGNAKLGFFGATPVAKPTITGSKGANAALASLLTSLASYGILIDSST